MRKPTHDDAMLLLKLYELRREPEMRAARSWVMTNPPLTWEELKDRYLSHEEHDRYVRMVSSYWQMVGTLVNRGILHAEIFFEHTGEDIVAWEKCARWIEGARRDIRTTYCGEFEQLVKSHQAYRARKIAELEHRAAPGAGGRRRAGTRGRRPSGGGR
jgi:hypothetical protein